MADSLLGKFGTLFSPNDPELIEKTLTRIQEQDTWNDVFSTKLIELLDKIDGLKSELRSRMRSSEQSIVESRRLLEQSTAQLSSEVRSRMHNVEQLGVQARQSLEQASAHLTHACSIEKKATVDLYAAHQSHTSSQDFLKSAQRALEASEQELKAAHITALETNRRYLAITASFKKAAVWVACAVAVSWVAVVWIACLISQHVRPLWIPLTATATITLAAAVIVSGVTREA